MADGMDVADRPAPETRADSRPGKLRDDDTKRRDDASDRSDQRQDDGKSGAGKRDNEGKKKRGSRRLWIILAVVAVLAIAGGVYYWLSTKDIESTDDAYTDGYAVTVAPQVSGQVVELAVRDNQFVHAGDVLVRIDQRQFVANRDQAVGNLEVAHGQLVGARFGSEVARKNFPASLAQSSAQLQNAQAQLFKAQADARRQHALPKAATTQQDVDNADAALRSAEAQVALSQAQVQQNEPVQQNIGEQDARVEQLDGTVKQAQGQLDQANLNIEWSVVRAPQDGWVTKRSVNNGDYLQAGQAIMTLVTPQVWVTANFKENQLDRMRPGQAVDMSVDAYPGLKLTGHVDSVQLGSGSRFSAFPAENATGNFVKIVQRIPVKLVIDHGLDPNLPLPLGVSVVPTVHLK